jgi:hypothetical protein
LLLALILYNTESDEFTDGTTAGNGGILKKQTAASIHYKF